MDFSILATTVAAKKGGTPYGSALLVFDPGHTTGWAYFKDGELVICGQLDTQNITDATKQFQDLFTAVSIDHVLFEEYRVYSWKAKHHSGSDLLTARIIGCIETLAVIHRKPYYWQSAQIGKGFCTDEKLKEWGMYEPAQRHASDAIRHGCHVHIFGLPTTNSDTTKAPRVG